jgi:hypothetical protein
VHQEQHACNEMFKEHKLIYCTCITTLLLALLCCLLWALALDASKGFSKLIVAGFGAVIQCDSLSCQVQCVVCGKHDIVTSKVVSS